MILDSFTLLACSTALVITIGLVFVLLWTLDTRSAWLLWWGAPLVLNGLALTLYIRPGWETDFFSILGGNAVRIFCVGSMWGGIRQFQGKSPPWKAIIAISAVWVGFCLFPPFIDSLAARITVVSLIFAFISAMVVWELLTDRTEGLRSRAPLIVVFASFSIFHLVRSGFSSVAPFPFGAGPGDPTWLAMFSWVTIGHGVFASVLFLTITLERREAQQRNFAMSDQLTSLLNRRAFSEFGQRIGRRRADEPLALLILDLDNFKQINDRFGHDAGDRLLKAFAEVAEANVRPSDQLFRIGGEEFCFVFPDTSLADAILVAERIRKAFEATSVDVRSHRVSTTVSIGIAATRVSVEVGTLVAAADAAVYEAKARGRNRVVVAEPGTLIRPQAEQVADRQRRRA